MSLRAEFLDQVRNVHLEHLGHLIEPHVTEPLVTPDIEFLFLCFTNRCGSNLVAELLASTGKFNLAGEFFNFDTVLAHKERLGFRGPSQYVDHLCQNQAKNRVLTSKLAVTHLALLHKAGILDQIINRSKFVAIERSDRLAQAISLTIASQNQQWTSYMSKQVPEAELKYSYKQLENIISSIIHQQHLFHLFFALNGLTAYTLTYEQFTSEPQLYISSLMRWLGFAGIQVDLSKIQVAQQASSLNHRWRELFLAQTGCIQDPVEPCPVADR